MNNKEKLRQTKFLSHRFFGTHSLSSSYLKYQELGQQLVSEPCEFESSPEMAPETGALVAGAGKLAEEEQKAGGSSVVFQ